MHILMLVAVGLFALALFAAIGRVIGHTAGLIRAARIFIWVWLAASLINASVGVVSAGIPLVNEIGAFIPIFGVPAAAAWYVARAFGGKA